MNLLTRRDTCRLCGSPSLELVVPITATPVAGAFVSRQDLDQTQPTFPLDMYMCGECSHVQLLDIVDASELFRDDYSYASGNSAGLVEHFGEYAQRVMDRHQLPKGSLVVDIGSNDGTFLKFLQEAGHRVLGIEPAEGVATLARAAGIETMSSFWNAATANRILASHGPASVVAANNVFAHMDDLAGAADSVRALLAKDGVFVFEVSYLLDVIDNMLLGSIFHEHLSYHSVKPLSRFLAEHGLALIDVQRESIQGGSLICTAQREGDRHAVDPSVARILELEEARQLHRPETLRAFSDRLERVRKEVKDTIGTLQDQGATLAGFGAARGGTLLIYHFGLGEVLRYVVDDSPDKQGTYTPGHHIPVLPSSTIYETPPDYLFVLAWVHARPIIRNHSRYLDNGGHFIVFSPEVKIITRDDNPYA